MTCRERLWGIGRRRRRRRPALRRIARRDSSAWPSSRAALKRRAWLWCLTGVARAADRQWAVRQSTRPLTRPRPQSCSMDNPNQRSQLWQITERRRQLAQSQAVAALVVKQLGLSKTVSSFLAASTVTVRHRTACFRFNVGAPSSQRGGAAGHGLGVTGFLEIPCASTSRASSSRRWLSNLDQQVQPRPSRQTRFDQPPDKPGIEAEPSSSRRARPSSPSLGDAARGGEQDARPESNST